MNRLIVLTVIALGLSSFSPLAVATRQEGPDGIDPGRRDKVIGVFSADIDVHLANGPNGTLAIDESHSQLGNIQNRCPEMKNHSHPACRTLPMHGKVEAEIKKGDMAGPGAVVGLAVCYAAGVLYGDAMLTVDPTNQVSFRNLYESKRVDFSKLATPKEKELAKLISSWVVSYGGRLMITKAMLPYIQGVFAAGSTGIVATVGTAVAVCFVAGVAGKATNREATRYTQQIYAYVVSKSQNLIQAPKGR